MKTVQKEKKFNNTELSAFSGQMALILRSGISATEGIFTLEEDAADPAEERLLHQIAENLINGNTFSEALRNTGMFPDYMTKMIHIGEQTGTLDETMRGLEAHYEREEHIRRTLKNAVTFPAVMIIMMLVVVFVLLTKVMPIFEQVYAQLGTEMTGVSSLLLRAGTALNDYGSIFLLLILLVLLLVFFFAFTKTGRRLFNSFGAGKKYALRIASCRFCGAVALGFSSGLSSDEAINLAGDLNENPDFKERFLKVSELTEQGRSLTDALHEAGILSGFYARMARIGEKTGSLDEVMQKVASLEQDALDTEVSNRLSAIEPFLVIFLSVIVGAILLSVMLPLIGIMSGL